MPLPELIFLSILFPLQLALAHALAAAPTLRTVYLDEGDDLLWRGYDEDDEHRRAVGYYGLGMQRM